jgi:hypothetical protein
MSLAFSSEYRCETSSALCLKIEIFGNVRRVNLASPGNLSSKKINPGTNPRLQKTHPLSVEEGAITKFRLISFVTVERFPNSLAADTKYLHAHQSRFLKDPGVAVLDKQKPLMMPYP